MRRYSTLQLILRHWYSGAPVPDDEAIEELSRRGWWRPFRVAVLVIIVPFILPERILVQLDMGDPWEEADWSTIGNSVLFSAWMVSPVAFLITGLLGVAKSLDGSVVNWWPAIVSGGIFAAITAYSGIRYWWAKKHEA